MAHAPALDAGWSDRQLLEAFADTVRTILTNYFNHYVGTELDLPPAPTWTRRSRTTSCPSRGPRGPAPALVATDARLPGELQL
jgi:hypothetical protein